MKVKDLVAKLLLLDSELEVVTCGNGDYAGVAIKVEVRNFDGEWCEGREVYVAVAGGRDTVTITFDDACKYSDFVDNGE